MLTRKILMKKQLLITLQTLAIIFLILLTIQIVDEKINGDDYKKIRQYSRNISTIFNGENYCTENTDEIFKIIFYDNYKNSNIAIDKISFDRRIQTCKDIMKEIDDVKIPDVKSQKKKELMNTFKQSMLASIYNYMMYFETYNNCPERNASCMEAYKIQPAELQSSGDMIFSGMQMLSKYTVKDILILKPLTWWFKLLHNNSVKKYTAVVQIGDNK